jgi:phosphoribosylformylglycinamidine synthase
VAEACRKVACTGAKPVAATNCLNFGNPEKPEIMAQLSAAIDGIAEACTALGTPITGGNVSLYNETKGEGIYPTPVVGIVGIIEDVTKAVPSSFQRAGDLIIVIGTKSRRTADWKTELGSSQFSKEILGSYWGKPPALDLTAEDRLGKVLEKFAMRGLISSATDVSEGGLAVALAEAGFAKGIGVAANVDHLFWQGPLHAFFGEDATQVIVTSSGDSATAVLRIVDETDGLDADIIGTTTAGDVTICWDDRSTIQTTVAALRAPWSSALEAALHDEVHA